MLPDILSKSITKVTDDFNISNKQEISELFIPYMNDNKKKFVFPGAVSRKLNISIDQSFTLLNVLKNDGLLKRVYEFRCPDTNYKKMFKDTSYINLPEKILCEDCGEEFFLRDNLYVIYEVNFRI
ncbi:hypothetical protein [Streptococcus gwangjuensis]|uniref:hypothetical protein n=1 Tax=Streptococcus gwangjuensis TaxID=1433513 RepID=UPI002306CB4D|nr:hypothetical protein [Streptococcus gwangjuense]MDB0075920.1 hypothetical protein [Streptococcus gwangjuense]